MAITGQDNSFRKWSKKLEDDRLKKRLCLLGHPEYFTNFIKLHNI